MLLDLTIACMLLTGTQVGAVMAEQMSTRALLGLEQQTYLMGQKFTGSVTYYGALEPSPYDTNGHGAPIKCSSSWKPDGWMSACINQASWDDGKLCGTCLRACWKETKECWNDGWNSAECEAAKAAGPQCHNMIIDNWTDSGRPGQMLPGWLDIAEYGDGDWPVEWEVIACPNPSGQLQWRAKQGHNSHWASVKVEGTPGPVQSISCNGRQHDVFTSDAWFRFDGGGDLMPLKCTATMPDGTTYSSPTFQGDGGAYSNIEASSGEAVESTTEEAAPAVESTPEDEPGALVVEEEEEEEAMPSQLALWLKSFAA